MAVMSDAKKVFRQQGTCSRTLFHLLDREFGDVRIEEERAVDSLAGGILQQGHQCGMLWGAAMAAGAEAGRRFGAGEMAGAAAVVTAGHLTRSFAGCTGCVDCRDFTGTDFSKPLQFLRYILTRTGACFQLAQDWAPDAFRTIESGLRDFDGTGDTTGECLNCASETVRRMGGSPLEATAAAGLAGGVGLSGHGCGALGAAIWKRSVEWGREHPKRFGFMNPAARKTLAAFREAAGSRMLCRDIAGRKFRDTRDHSGFIRDGGCGEIIDALSSS